MQCRPNSSSVMSLSSSKSSVDDRTRLAHALGFSEYPTNSTAEPYLNYILKQYAGSQTIEDYIELFIEVLEHFRPGAVAKGAPAAPTVQTLIEKFASTGFRDVFADTVAGDPRRKEHVEDTVMCIIGTWTTMLSSFQHKNRSRRVVAAYSLFADATTTQATPSTSQSTTTSASPSVPVLPYDNSVAGLVAGSGLLPGGQWDYRTNVDSDATVRMIALVLSASNSPHRNSLQNLLSPSSAQALPCRMSCTNP